MSCLILGIWMTNIEYKHSAVLAVDDETVSMWMLHINFEEPLVFHGSQRPYEVTGIQIVKNS